MGSSYSQQMYSKPAHGSAALSYSPIFEHAIHPTLENDKFQSLLTARDCFMKAVRDFGDKAFIGHRMILEDGKLGDYVWNTYDEVNTMALNIGAALKHEGLVPEIEFEKMEHQSKFRFLAIYSNNRPEWTITEEACHAHGITIIPLYDTLGENSTEYIINMTKLKTISASPACGLTMLSRLVANIEESDNSDSENRICPTLKAIIIMGDVTKEMAALGEKCGVTVYSWKKIMAIGRDNVEGYPLPTVRGDNINTICFTSGTTGNPKGVMLTELNLTSAVRGAIRSHLSRDDFMITENDISISYLPLAHVFERAFNVVFKTIGGKIGFYSGDVKNLTDDLKALKPTVMCVVPRVLTKIREKIFEKVGKKSALAQFIFNKGLSLKMKSIENSGVNTHVFWDNLIFSETRNATGGNLRYMISGSAPLDARVQLEMRCMMCIPIIQGYGLTESFAASLVAYPSDPTNGHCGSPISGLKLRVKSVPEMQYYATKEEYIEKYGNANSFRIQGELLMQGDAMFVGYFQDEAETEAVYEDGWFKSGDICEVDPIHGGFKIIDRAKNIFKLAQGEYITPDKVESVYTLLPIIEQILVYGNSTQSYLVAAIGINMHVANEFMRSKGMSDSTVCKLEYLEECEEFLQYVRDEMERKANDAKLLGFQRVKKFIFMEELMSVDNGLLTPSMKMKRNDVVKLYKPALEALYG